MIQQQHRDRLYELDQPGTGPQPARPPAAPPGGPPPGWIGLEQCNISPLPGHALHMPLVLLHPEVGVALVDLAPDETPGAEEAFRARLEAARFAAIFPGTLPVAHLHLPPEAIGQLGPVLREAFAALPPISLPGGDGWVSVVRRALASRMTGRGPVPPPGERQAPPPAMLNREVAAQRAGLASGPAAPPAARRARTRWPSIPVAIGLAAAAAAASAAAVLWSGPRQPEPLIAAAPEASGAAPGPAAGVTGGGAATPLPAPAPRAPEPSAAAPAPVATALVAPAREQAQPPPVPATANATNRVMVRAAANLRASPSNTAPVLRTVPTGEVLREFSRSSDGWVEVGDTQPRGWIFSKLLVPPKP